jgi:hypothetical protein
MFVLPSDEAAVGVFVLSIILHILIPSLMVIIFLLYINHEVSTKFMVTSDKQLVWVRCLGLILSSLFSFGYLSYYVAVNESTCQATVAIFQALPAVSKFSVHLFYALRYRNLAQELNMSKWPIRGFLPVATFNLLIGWIPYWTTPTAVDEQGLCATFFGERELAFIAVFMVVDIALGAFMLYIFAKPFLTLEKSRQRVTSTEVNGFQDKSSHGTDHNTAFRKVLRKAFLSSVVSLVSTVVTSIILAFAFYWTPTLPVLFGSDIASLLDAAVSCFILLYSYKDFEYIFPCHFHPVVKASQEQAGTIASSGHKRNTSLPPSPNNAQTPSV